MTGLIDLHGRPLASAAAGRAAYSAASTAAPEFAGWHVPQIDSDSITAGARQPIAERARDLARNDGLIAGAVQAHKDKVVGDGLRLQALPDNHTLDLTPAEAQDKARELEALWEEWAGDPEAADVTGHATFGGLTRLAVESDWISGESFALALWEPARQAGRGVRFATTLQMIEPIRVSNPMSRTNDDRLRDGVEIDAFGAPQAYHIRDREPGSRGLDLKAAFRWTRVPRRRANGRLQVLHCFDRRRPGEHRGVSAFAPIMEAVKQRSRYQRAELQSSVVNAVISAVLEVPFDGQTLLDIFGDSTDDIKRMLDARAQAAPLRLGIGPGGIIPRLEPGERLTSWNTGRPNRGYDKFTTAIERYIAVGLGYTYETFARDFSKTNFSSARASILEAWRTVMTTRLQKATYWARPVYELVIEEAVARERIDLPGFFDSRAARRAWLRSAWLGPGRGAVDPTKELLASGMALALNLSTHRQEAMELGRDPDALLDQIEAERAAMAARGIRIPALETLMPAVAALAGADEQQPATAASQSDIEQEETA